MCGKYHPLDLELRTIASKQAFKTTVCVGHTILWSMTDVETGDEDYVYRCWCRRKTKAIFRKIWPSGYYQIEQFPKKGTVVLGKLKEVMRRDEIGDGMNPNLWEDRKQ